jgi:hypothetical protein
LISQHFKIVFVFLFLIFACNTKDNKRQRETIALLKNDIVFKSKIAKENKYAMISYCELNPHRIHVFNQYNFIEDLFKFYDSIGLNDQQSAYRNSFSYAFDKVDRYDIKDTFGIELGLAKDSFDFYLMKSNYLGKIINAQIQIFEHLPNPPYRLDNSNF